MCEKCMLRWVASGNVAYDAKVVATSNGKLHFFHFWNCILQASNSSILWYPLQEKGSILEPIETSSDKTRRSSKSCAAKHEDQK